MRIGGSWGVALVREYVTDGGRFRVVVHVARAIVVDVDATARPRIPGAEPYVVFLVVDADADHEAVGTSRLSRCAQREPDVDVCLMIYASILHRIITILQTSLAHANLFISTCTVTRILDRLN